MKTVLALLTAAVVLPGHVFAQADVIIKKHALELRDQNNVRQGVAPPSQPARPATTPATSAATTAIQQSIAKLRADFVAIKANAPVPADQKQQITKDLIAVAQGANKPSQLTAANLAGSLSAALAEKPFVDKDYSRLLSDLAAVLNPAKIQATQMQAIYADIQALFQANGTTRKDAVKIVDQVKAVAAETQRPPA
ncbi:MAG: hypothetical protein NT154_41915 [Verrucomicrobia bacterium]|nr:hypothetical protein [Verrucomicrobiota bacterium]